MKDYRLSEIKEICERQWNYPHLSCRTCEAKEVCRESKIPLAWDIGQGDTMELEKKGERK